MKVIDAKYNDLKFQLDIQGMTGNDMTAADFNVFDVTIYTVDSSIEPQYHKDDIPEDGILTVSSQLLENLSDGQISILIHYNFEDSEYPDNTVDKTINRHTKYYLDNSNYVSPDKKYPTEWGMIEGIIEKQTDLTDYIDQKITDGTEDYYTKSEIENKHYLTAHQSLTDYAKKTDLNNYSLTTHKHNDYSLTNHVHNNYSLTNHVHDDYSLVGHTHDYLTEHQPLTDYAKKTDLDNYSLTDHKHDNYSLVGHTHDYLTEHQSLAGYATENYVDNKVKDVSVDLTGYATENYVDKKIADVSIKIVTPDGDIDLSGFATKLYVDNAIKDVSVNLTGYATEEYVNNIINDVSVDLTGYATENYVQESISNIQVYQTNFIVLPEEEYNLIEPDDTKVYIITK